VFESQVGPIFLPFCAFWHDEYPWRFSLATRSPIFKRSLRSQMQTRQLSTRVYTDLNSLGSESPVRHSSLARYNPNSWRFTCLLD
jgi:hypothetical protein